MAGALNATAIRFTADSSSLCNAVQQGVKPRDAAAKFARLTALSK
jgi:hypothetical protein